jgi:hypothetical protein
MTLMLAFYKGEGDWIDRAVRWATRSPYSHVEMARAKTGGLFVGLSSSIRDGGVRIKSIARTPGHWDFVPVPWADADAAWQYARVWIGAGYDLPGILGSQIVALRRQRPDRWFCSELCAAALGLGQPETISPGGLHARVQDMTRAYDLGRAERSRTC